MIEHTRFLSTVISCSAFKLDRVSRIVGKSKKFRATRPAHGIMVTLTNTPGWYLWTLVNTATKSDTDAYPIGGQRSIKIGIPKGMVFGPFHWVWKRVYTLPVLVWNRVWNRVTIWRTRWHTPTKKSQEHPLWGSARCIFTPGELTPKLPSLWVIKSPGFLIPCRRKSYLI